MRTITTSGNHGLQPGDIIEFVERKPWWKRFWDWITRKKKPVFQVLLVKTDTASFYEIHEQ